MQQLQSSLWVCSPRSGEFSGVLTWVTPSALFRVGAASRSFCGALSTLAARSYCQFMCNVNPEDWVYIDDLTAENYNHNYAQVLGPQGSRDSTVLRYGCAIYGVSGKKVSDRRVHQQMFRTVSLPIRNLFKVHATVVAVRLYADGEVVPPGAMRLEGTFFGSSHVSNVSVPGGLCRCIKKAQLCPLMKNTSVPLVLQDVEMLNEEDAQGRRCILASQLKMPVIYLGWDGGDHDKYWMDRAGPHLVFRADGSNFRIQDMVFVSTFLKFIACKADEHMHLPGGFSDALLPSLFMEFKAKYPNITVTCPLTGSERKLDGDDRGYGEHDGEDRGYGEHFDEESDEEETPVPIDEEVAAVAADVAWMEQVEDRIRADLVSLSRARSCRPTDQDAHADQAASDGMVQREKINLLRMGSPPTPGDSLQEFRQILMHGKHLKMCRSALEEEGLQFVLPQGALMVVTPEQHTIVRHGLLGTELHPFHLIVAEQFDYLIEEVLADFPYKRRPRIKAGTVGRQELCVCTGSSRMELDEDSIEESSNQEMDKHVQTDAGKSTSPKPSDQYPVIVESRTFLCEAPVLKSAANACCQSTTEVTVEPQQSQSHYGYRRGVNPRRY